MLQFTPLQLSQLSFGSIGQQLLVVLGMYNRICQRHLGPWPGGLQARLREAHFDTGDYKLVRAVIATDSKCLIAEEDDYSSKVKKLLKKSANVCVHSASGACEIIEGNPPCTCGATKTDDNIEKSEPHGSCHV